MGAGKSAPDSHAEDSCSHILSGKKGKCTVKVLCVSPSANPEDLKVFFRFHGDIVDMRSWPVAEG